jgi:hypothetical protein
MANGFRLTAQGLGATTAQGQGAGFGVQGKP